MTKFNTSRRPFLLGVSALAALSLVVGGCTSDDEIEKAGETADSMIESDLDALTGQTTAVPTESNSGPNDTTVASDSAQGSITWSRAIEIALAESQGASVVEIERDTSGGVAVWELDLLTPSDEGVEIKIAVDDGRIVKQGSTRIGADHRPAPAVTALDAITKALDAQPGELHEAEVETENGTRVWKIEIRSADGRKVKVHVDATTGEMWQRTH